MKKIEKKVYYTSKFGLVFFIICTLILFIVPIVKIFVTWILGGSVGDYLQEVSSIYVGKLGRIHWEIPFFLLWMIGLCSSRIKLFEDKMVLVSLKKGLIINKKSILYGDIEFVSVFQKTSGLIHENSVSVKIKGDNELKTITLPTKKYNELIDELEKKGIKIVQGNRKNIIMETSPFQ